MYLDGVTRAVLCYRSINLGEMLKFVLKRIFNPPNVYLETYTFGFVYI